MRFFNDVRLVRRRPRQAFHFEALEAREMYAAGDLDTTLGSQGIGMVPLTLVGGDSAGRCNAMATDAQGLSLIHI